MQIISGKYRGKRLVPLYNEQTRTTTNRVRENIFNLLGDIVPSSHVLDLFAGSGAHGAECLSRGAKRVVLNDIDETAIQVIRKNIAGMSGAVEIHNTDYLVLLQKLSERGDRFDLIFLDPPYQTDLGESAVNLIFGYNLLKDTGVIILESDRDFSSHHYNIKQKEYGKAKIHILRLMKTRYGSS